MIFLVFGKSYDDYLHNLKNVLKGYEETNLVLNWKKMSFYSTRRDSPWSL